MIRRFWGIPALLLTTAALAQVSGGPLSGLSVINGATIPASQSCLGSNSTSQLIAGTCGGGVAPPIPLSDLATQSPRTILGNSTGASAAPTELTALPFTLGSYSAAGCSNSTLTGGTFVLGAMSFASGSFTAGATGTCTVTFTFPAVLHTWACWANDVTSQITFVQTINGTTTCTVSAAAALNDVVTFIGVGS